MRRIGTPTLFFLLCFVSTGWRQAGAQTQAEAQSQGQTLARSRFITFDAPGAGTAADQGTFPEQISNSGLIVGNYVDGNGVNHGFVREPNGRITTFDVPGGGTGPGEGTVPNGITDTGVVVGGLFDGSHVFHGFFGRPGGHFTTFEGVR